MEKRRLRALDQFHCLADRCPDNCCGVWQVEVDEETLRKWQGLPGEERGEFMSHVDTERKGGETLTWFRKNEDGNCCHLDARGLCRLQAAGREEVLPRICRDYPRTTLKNSIRELSAATLACQEMARLVLEGEGPLFSIEEGGGPGEEKGRSEGAVLAARFLDVWVRRTMEISAAPLEQRIFYLASVIGQLSARRNAGGQPGELLVPLCGDPGAHLERIAAAAEGMDPGRHGAAASAFWRRAWLLGGGADLTVGGRSLGGTGLGRELSGTKAGEEDLERLHARYLECRGAARGNLESLAPRLERLVIFSLMNKGFPWHPVGQDHVARLIECLTPFTMVMIAVCALGGEGRPVGAGELCEIVWKVEERMAHSNVIQQDLSAQLQLLQLHHYAPIFLLL